ncbi:MAG: YdcF family protein [Thiobacillus sp.]|nr:YdcF family protein [Thiobacillus sp.]
MALWLTSKLIAAALLPPLVLVILLATGLIVRRRHPMLSMSLILAATAALLVLSTPWAGGVLFKSLEISQPISVDKLKHSQAIVVLGGGRRIDAPEYNGDTLNSLSLERLRYAARLARASGLPLLVAGGKPNGGSEAEGDLMARILREEFGLTARWIENTSRTTWENARHAAPLLHESGKRRVVLVTHAWHLRRAVPLFEAQGLTVLPAGTQFARTQVSNAFDLIPSPAGLRDSSFALHEWLGILWYKLRTPINEGTA